MVEKKNSLECNAICWGIAAFVGFISMVMLVLLAEFSVLQAIFIGGLIGFLLGLVLSLFVCRGQKAAADLQSEEKPAQRYAREAAEDKARREGQPAPVAPSAGSASASGAAAAGSAATSGAGTGEAGSAGGASSAASASAAGSSGGAGTGEAGSAGGDAVASGSGTAANTTPASFASSGIKPSTPLAGEAELASRKGTWKYGADGDAAPEAAASASAPEEAPAAAKAEAAPAAASSAAVPEPAPVAADGKPALYDGPPAEGADDLKLISGVGPKLEQTLNDLGIYRFAQVAVWRAEEIAWVDDRLRFKGRIERDDWMSQAKILAEGGETEFSQRKKK